MIAMALLGRYGFLYLRTNILDRYMHAISRVVVAICGAGMVFGVVRLLIKVILSDLLDKLK